MQPIKVTVIGKADTKEANAELNNENDKFTDEGFVSTCLQSQSLETLSTYWHTIKPAVTVRTSTMSVIVVAVNWTELFIRTLLQLKAG